MDELSRATSPIIKLRDNWVAVDSSVIKRARKRLIRTVTPVQALAVTLTGVVDVEDVPYEAIVGASLLKVRDRLRDAATGEPVAVPAGLQAELRDYQHRGLGWLAELTSLGLGACLADDMGLGKTITLIALHLHRQGLDGAGGPTLVVCPASLLGNWEAEIRRFAPGVRRTPPPRQCPRPRRRDERLRAHDLRHDAQRRRAPRGGAVGPRRRRRGAAHQELPVRPPPAPCAPSPAPRGSRSPARPSRTTSPSCGRSSTGRSPACSAAATPSARSGPAPIESGLEPTKARQFADLIGPFLLRRRKSDPGIAPELPAKTETDHLLGLTREQVVLYETLVRESMRRIEEADEETRRGLVLKLLTGLKQICNHPAHYLRQPNPKLRGRSEKLELLDELVGTVIAEDGAVLVFTQYVAMADLLVRHLGTTGVPHQLLHGGTPVRARDAMVTRFQAGEIPVFLLSLKAGGTGLNLTRADHVIHFDRWWNPAVEDQATDRAYRIGQTKPVQVHRFVTQGTIEEKIAELLARKRSIADSVLARGETALTELSDSELRDLVELQTMNGTETPASPTRGCRPGAAAAPAPGGARRCCAPSRRRRSARPTCGPAARWPAPAPSARSPSATAARWPRSPTATTRTRSR